MVCELALRSIAFERQKEVSVHYKGRLVGKHRLDLVVDNRIVLELKAVAALTDAFRHQTRSYLRETGLRLGLLVNFGPTGVESDRVLN